MPDQIRVNYTRRVVNSEIRKEKRDGRDVVVVPSATLPDDIVMNNILYPAQEIEKGYKSLENTPAPLGHPQVNGNFVSARSPLGLNLGYFGAWNANVRRENGRVHIDKIIDVQRASESEMGRRVLNAIEKQEPIHTSTGVLMHLRPCANSDLAESEGYDMEFDHDAILLDERGAATPDQGVGMLVNGVSVPVQNVYEDDELDYLGQEMMRMYERKRNVSRWERVKAAVLKALAMEDESEPEKEDVMSNENTSQRDNDPVLSAIAALNIKLDDAVAKANSAFEAVEAMRAEAAAETAKKRDALVNSVVEKKLLPEAEAKEAPESVLNALLANAPKPKASPGLGGSFTPNDSAAISFNPLEV